MSRVKERREALGMRREGLAAKAGVSLSFILQLESQNPPDPSLDRSRRIARALDTTVDKLFPVDSREKARA
jgi:transcriptional regulator with XRE-family HTH domain